MPGRKCLVYTLWLLPSLMLLAWVLVAPTWKSGLVAVSSQPDCQHKTLDGPQAEPSSHLRAGTAGDDATRVDALACEDEEQDRVDALNEPRASFLITRSFRKLTARQSILPRSILSHYPIRC